MLDSADHEPQKLSRKILGIQSCSDSIHAIQREVARHFEIEVSDITGQSRLQRHAVPRHIAIWLSRELVWGSNGKPVSLPILGSLFGGRDHSTIINALRRMQKEIEEGGELAKLIETLRGGLMS